MGTPYQTEKGFGQAEAKWWADTRGYREWLARCSEQELEDIYFHINILKQPEKYRAVLTELERRRLRPQVSDRPLEGCRWDIEQWTEYFRFTRRRRWAAVLGAWLVSFGFGLVATFGFFLPFWLLIVVMRVNNLASAFVYLFCLPLPLVAAWVLAPPYGRRGRLWWPVAAGVLLAVFLFAKTGTFGELVRPLVEPERTPGRVISIPGF